jgi:hypothetical protein
MGYGGYLEGSEEHILANVGMKELTAKLRKTV